MRCRTVMMELPGAVYAIVGVRKYSRYKLS